MESALARLEFTGSQLELLQAQLEAHLDALVNEQAAHILRETNVAGAYAALQETSDIPLSSRVGMDPATVRAAMVSASFDHKGHLNAWLFEGISSCDHADLTWCDCP